MNKEQLIQEIYCKLIKLGMYDVDYMTTMVWLKMLDDSTLGDIIADLPNKEEIQ